MALYRVMRTLDAGKKRGLIYAVGEDGLQTVTDLNWLTAKQREILVRCGAVSPIAAPPLDVLPGWTLRAAKLADLGIKDAVQLIEANAEVLAQGLGYQPRTVKKWQAEAEGYLLPYGTRKR